MSAVREATHFPVERGKVRSEKGHALTKATLLARRPSCRYLHDRADNVLVGAGDVLDVASPHCPKTR
jgi:hypothetical protein